MNVVYFIRGEILWWINILKSKYTNGSYGYGKYVANHCKLAKFDRLPVHLIIFVY